MSGGMADGLLPGIRTRLGRERNPRPADCLKADQTEVNRLRETEKELQWGSIIAS